MTTKFMTRDGLVHGPMQDQASRGYLLHLCIVPGIPVTLVSEVSVVSCLRCLARPS